MLFLVSVGPSICVYCAPAFYIDHLSDLRGIFLGMEPGRTQGQVTSSSEIGLGSPLGSAGQPGQGQSSNKDLSQGIEKPQLAMLL